MKDCSQNKSLDQAFNSSALLSQQHTQYPAVSTSRAFSMLGSLTSLTGRFPHKSLVFVGLSGRPEEEVGAYRETDQRHQKLCLEVVLCATGGLPQHAPNSPNLAARHQGKHHLRL